MRSDTKEKLDAAIRDSIVILGIGGYIKSNEFGSVYNKIDAVDFAKIMYATEQLLYDFEGDDSVNPANIPLMIEIYDFEKKRHFSQVVEIFQKHFGTNIAYL